MALKIYKKSLPYSYALGTFPTIELLTTKPQHCKTVLISSDAQDSEGMPLIRELCNKHNIRIDIANKTIGKIAIKERTLVIGVFDKYSADIKKNKNHIVLVNPSLPGNLGTIIRAATGFDVTDLAIIKPACDIFDPKAVRSSMGAVFKVNFTYFDTFEDYVAKFPENTSYPFVLNSKNLLSNVVFKQPASLVFGNEGEGLDTKFEKFDTSIKIDHSNEIDSLNLATATGIALYSLYQQN